MLSFNTHDAIKKLVATGVKEPQAEQMVNIILEGRAHDLSQLATKEQFFDLKAEVSAVRIEISEVKTEIALIKKGIDTTNLAMATKTDLEKLKIQMIMWLGGFFIALSSIIIGSLQYFLK